MAFFTRPNISVPILPPMEAQSNELNATTNGAAVADKKEANDSGERYEYTVETFGVQV